MTGPVPGRSRSRATGVYVLALLAALPLVAQEAQDLTDLELAALLHPPPTVTLRVAGVQDDAQGTSLQGRLTWQPTRRFSVFVSGGRSDLASTTQAPSPDGTTTTTTLASLGGERSFGTLHLGLRGDHARLSGLLASNRIALLPAMDVGAWRIGLELSTRSTDFDRLQFRDVVLNTPTGPVTVTGYADLEVRDTGLGLDLDRTGEIWHLYATYLHYSYGSLGGTTDVSRIRTMAGGVSPEMFRLLSGRLVRRLEQLSGRRLTGQASLLDESATLGLEADLLRSRWGLEASRDVDHFTGESASTLLGTATWKVHRRFSLEVQAGATRSETFGTDRFVGVGFTVASNR